MRFAMMREFQIGDHLRVRQWDDMAAEFGVTHLLSEDIIPCKFHFVEDMRKLCGMKFTVSNIDGAKLYSEEGVEKLRDWNNWSISADMLEYDVSDDENISLNSEEIEDLFKYLGM